MSEESSSGPFIFGGLRHFGDVLTRNARASPGEIGAISAESGARLTWAELNARANRFANAMSGLSIASGDRVALVSENLPEYAEVFFGCAKLGAPVVNVNYRLTARDLANVLRDAQPSLLVVSERFSGVVDELRALGAELPAAVLCIGNGSEGATAYETFCAGASADEPEPGRPIGPLDPLVIGFSSGTTGVPKGVIWSHRGTMLNSLGFAYELELRTGMRLMMASALSAHCGMLVIGALVGCPLVFANFDGPAILDAIEATGTQYLNLVPVLIERLCDAQETARRDLGRLTDICYGGSPISRETVLRATEVLKVRFHQIYSLTEACMSGCVLRPEDHVAGETEAGRRRLISAGRPMLSAAVRLLDGDRVVARGEVGEIAIRSEGNMLGYWRNDELTARALRDGWVMSGDLGYEDEDGYIFIVDRNKDVIVSGSLNVYAVEIERALSAHDAVAEAAVFGIPDEKWGEAVHAAIVLRPGASVTAKELIEFCRRQVGGAKKPRSVEFLPDLPRNALGKVVKRQLREPYWAGRERVIG